MDTYALHLAIAALVGGSFVAVSAYYTHWKTLGQLLEFAKAVERDREENSDGLHRRRRGHHSSSRRKANGYYGRRSASLAQISGGEDRCDGSIPVQDGIPAGLPTLRTVPKEARRVQNPGLA